MEQRRLDVFKRLLQDQLEGLLIEASAEQQSSDEDMPGAGAAVLDLAAAESSRDFVLRIRARERLLIRKIEAALRRINDGEYGYCISCGGMIAEKRLSARPVATQCIDCKTGAEPFEQRGQNF